MAGRSREALDNPNNQMISVKTVSKPLLWPFLLSLSPLHLDSEATMRSREGWGIFDQGSLLATTLTISDTTEVPGRKMYVSPTHVYTHTLKCTQRHPRTHTTPIERQGSMVVKCCGYGIRRTLCEALLPRSTSCVNLSSYLTSLRLCFCTCKRVIIVVYSLRLKRGLKNTVAGLGDPAVKNLPPNAGDTGSIPGPGRSHVPWGN